MRILVRLPNWLGDVVMSVGFMNELKNQYPSATIDVICKKGLDGLLPYFNQINKSYIFSKSEFKGIFGAYKFGAKIKSEYTYDLFFCLPDSFSSAIMGYAIGATNKIGYKNELRSIFLTNSYTKPLKFHRVNEYHSLLRSFLQKEIDKPEVFFTIPKPEIKNQILVNFNSEASSRRMPILKAVQILSALSKKIATEIILIGAQKDEEYTNAICTKLNLPNIKNFAGQTTLPQLVELMNCSKLMLSVDSGPSHLCNALQTPVIVIHGADDENNTEAYNKEFVKGIRLGQLPCEPCVKNTCKFGLPKCFELLNENLIIEKVIATLNTQSTPF